MYTMSCILFISQVANMEPFVNALLVEVMTTWPEASDLLSALEVTHTHHTTEACHF